MSINQENKIQLYHGSRNGIHGKIAPTSRKTCEFGQGFYLGTTKEQPMSLIAPKTFENARFYTVQLDLTGLTGCKFAKELTWVLYIAYNRGKFDINAYPQLKPLQEKFNKFDNEYDVLIGAVADDNVTIVLNAFFANALSYPTLLNCLEMINPSDQYVLKTEKACRHVELLKSEVLTDSQRGYIERNKALEANKVHKMVKQLQLWDTEQGNEYTFAYILTHWG